MCGELKKVFPLGSVLITYFIKEKLGNVVCHFFFAAFCGGRIRVLLPGYFRVALIPYDESMTNM